MLGRLQQERRTAVAQLEERRDRRLAIRDPAVGQCDLPAMCRELADLLERRRDRDLEGGRQPRQTQIGHVVLVRGAWRRASSAATSSGRTPDASHSTVRWYSRSALS